MFSDNFEIVFVGMFSRRVFEILSRHIFEMISRSFNYIRRTSSRKPFLGYLVITWKEKKYLKELEFKKNLVDNNLHTLVMEEETEYI